MGKRREDLDKQSLSRLYVDQKMSIREVAKTLGLTYSTVQKHLVNKGVPIRPRGLKIDPRKARVLYIDKGWSLRMIAEHFGATNPAVYLRLKAEGVKFRTPVATKKKNRKPEKKINPKTVIRLYVDRTLSLKEIGLRLKVAKKRVRQTLVDNGIKIRSQSFGKKDWIRPLYDLKVGETIVVKTPRPATNCRKAIWNIAKRISRRFSTRKLGPKQLKIKRLA